MTHLHVRCYEPKDFVSIVLSEPERELRDGQQVEEWALYHQEHGPACTVLDPDGEIVMCGGAHIPWKGFGEVWGTFSASAGKYPRIWHMVRLLIDHLYLDWGCERMECTVEPEWITAVRLVEKLGFARECIMAKRGPGGRDMALYSLIGGREND